MSYASEIDDEKLEVNLKQYCGELATDQQFLRIMGIVDKQYGFKERSFDAHEFMLKKHKARFSKSEMMVTVPVHIHSSENCQKYKCQKMSRDFRSQVYNVHSYMCHNVVKRYAGFINRVLNDQAWSGTTDPHLRRKYEEFCKQAKASGNGGHNFYDRMAVDNLLKEAKMENERKS